MRIEQVVQLSPSLISFDVELDASDLVPDVDVANAPVPAAPAVDQSGQ